MRNQCIRGGVGGDRPACGSPRRRVSTRGGPLRFPADFCLDNTSRYESLGYLGKAMKMLRKSTLDIGPFLDEFPKKTIDDSTRQGSSFSACSGTEQHSGPLRNPLWGDPRPEPLEGQGPRGLDPLGAPALHLRPRGERPVQPRPHRRRWADRPPEGPLRRVRKLIGVTSWSTSGNDQRV